MKEHDQRFIISFQPNKMTPLWLAPYKIQVKRLKSYLYGWLQFCDLEYVL